MEQPEEVELKLKMPRDLFESLNGFCNRWDVHPQQMLLGGAVGLIDAEKSQKWLVRTLVSKLKAFDLAP